MKITTLFIIRHGQTDWNLEGKVQGHIDIPLNDEGIKQAQQVAHFLKKKNVPFKALYSSDLQRAHQTAQEISEVCVLNIITTPNLQERHAGVMGGLTKKHIYELYGQGYDFDDEIIPSGEAKTAFMMRTTNQIALIAKAHINESVIVVTHGLVIRNFIAFAGYDKNEWPAITNAAIITVRYHHTDESQIELVSVEYADDVR